jgi:hypothetical protein
LRGLGFNLGEDQISDFINDKVWHHNRYSFTMWILPSNTMIASL